jgi:hypothetical protein
MNKRRSLIDTGDLEAVANMGVAPAELHEGGIEIDDIEIVPAYQAINAAQEAVFMNDKVVVEIEADDDPDAPEFLYTAHQGVTQYIKRGEPQTIKRKYLYSLIAAKRVKVACAFGRTNEGNEFNRVTPSAQTTHRVRLMRDDNPLGGMKWFQKMMASA